ncbi:hypothetical protein NL676_031335 [Syzygium grande]|nr:hypothetical protein NL676_031335 [Syzygium grande]
MHFGLLKRSVLGYKTRKSAPSFLCLKNYGDGVYSCAGPAQLFGPNLGLAVTGAWAGPVTCLNFGRSRPSVQITGPNKGLDSSSYGHSLGIGPVCQLFEGSKVGLDRPNADHVGLRPTWPNLSQI